METSGFDIPLSRQYTDTSLRLIYESVSGYCRIYSAVRNGRRIALKALKPEYLDSAIHIELLRKEYEIGHTLYHHNIAATLGYEIIDGVGPAIMMELVDGVTLDDYLAANTPLPRDKAMDITSQICDALDYLHSHQIIHRDLKPGNIMLANSGKFVKLIDFGLSDGTAYTDFKYAGGTRHYSAPEQLTSGTDSDPRVDIYSLGMIMQRMSGNASKGYCKVAAQCSAEDPELRPAEASSIPSLIRRKDQVRRLRILSLATAVLLSVGAVIAIMGSHGVVSQMTPIETLAQNTPRDTTEAGIIPATAAISAPATVPDLPHKRATRSNQISDQRLDSMIAYTRIYVQTELDKWYSSDSSKYSFDSYRLLQNVYRYAEEQCGGDPATFARIKPIISETATSVMHNFYSDIECGLP